MSPPPRKNARNGSRPRTAASRGGLIPRDRGVASKVARTAILVSALLLALLPLPASWVEGAYARGLYPVQQRVLTSLTNLAAPWAVADLLILALALCLPTWWIVRWRRGARGARARILARLALDSGVVIAAIYVAFMILWGLNYRREPLTAKLDYDPGRITAESRLQFARLGRMMLAENSPEAHRTPWIAGEELRRALEPAVQEAARDLDEGGRTVPPVPKTSLLQPYLQAAGVAGFTNPFGLEVIVDRTLLPFEVPPALAHEWAHLAGYASESEASFVAFLACSRAESAQVRYSAWLSLYDAGSLSAPSGDALPAVPSEVEADARAITERIRRYRRPIVSRMGWSVYDRYLKANRVKTGIEDYGEVLKLLLGTRFDADGAPLRRKGLRANDETGTGRTP